MGFDANMGKPDTYTSHLLHQSQVFVQTLQGLQAIPCKSLQAVRTLVF
jgi:hypothetical protein